MVESLSDWQEGNRVQLIKDQGDEIGPRQWSLGTVEDVGDITIGVRWDGYKNEMRPDGLWFVLREEIISAGDPVNGQ